MIRHRASQRRAWRVVASCPVSKYPISNIIGAPPNPAPPNCATLPYLEAKCVVLSRPRGLLPARGGLGSFGLAHMYFNTCEMPSPRPTFFPLSKLLSRVPWCLGGAPWPPGAPSLRALPHMYFSSLVPVGRSLAAWGTLPGCACSHVF